MNGDELERRARRALQGLPDLKAPATLEARVRGAIAARAALPWWQRPFAEWPAAVRIGFVLVSLALVGLAVRLGTGSSFSAAPAEWLARADGAVASLGGLFDLLGRLVPHTWLVTALCVGAALYTALFGLGAVLYRSFFMRPQSKAFLS